LVDLLTITDMPVLVCIRPGFSRALHVALRLYLTDFHIVWLKIRPSSHKSSCELD